MLQWFGPQVRRNVVKLALARMEEAGKLGVQVARAAAPVDTGQLRDSIGYFIRTDPPALVLYVGVDYGLYQEYGTATGTPEHPYLRPGLAAARTVWGGAAEIRFTQTVHVGIV